MHKCFHPEAALGPPIGRDHQGELIVKIPYHPCDCEEGKDHDHTRGPVARLFREDADFS